MGLDLDLDLVRERALVRAGWELVDVLGQLEMQTARRLLGYRWKAERARAAESLTPLKTGAAIGEHIRKLYEGPSVQARYLRTVDLIEPGERVLEIGPGRGYLAGLILRDGGAGAYRGIDVDDRNLSSTQEIFDLNGLADRGEVGTGDLRELTRAEVEKLGADLMICCEVLEHVPEPEAAAKILAAALPLDTDLLLSVPLLGRAEHVWGHISLFRTARIRDMIEDAGLVVHYVDVVDNTWVFVLASHRAEASPRAARAAARTVETLAGVRESGEWPRSVRDLPLDESFIGPSVSTRRLSRHHLEHTKKEVLCEATARRGRWSKVRPAAGIRLAVSGPRGFRLQLAPDAIADVTAFYLDAYAGEKRVGRWIWDPSKGEPGKKPPTFVARPGASDGHFRRVGKLDALSSADAVELYAVLKPGASARFRVLRAGLVT